MNEFQRSHQFDCPICSKSYDRVAGLRRHLQTSHRSVNPLDTSNNISSRIDNNEYYPRTVEIFDHISDNIPNSVNISSDTQGTFFYILN